MNLPPLESWSAWIQRQLDEHDWNFAEAERQKPRIPSSVWAQWVRRPERQVSLDNVHAVAQVLNVPVKTVMVYARYLTPEQADVVPVLARPLALVDATDEQLALELLRRIAARKNGDIGDDLRHYDGADLAGPTEPR